MVCKLIQGVAMSAPTDTVTEQLNVFGRNLNTVSRISKYNVISPADSDCRSKAKTGSVKGGLPLQTSMRELAR